MSFVARCGLPERHSLASREVRCGSTLHRERRDDGWRHSDHSELAVVARSRPAGMRHLRMAGRRDRVDRARLVLEGRRSLLLRGLRERLAVALRSYRRPARRRLISASALRPRFPAERAGPGKDGEAIGPGAWDQLTARFDPAWFNIGTRCAPLRRVGDAQAGYWNGCQTLPRRLNSAPGLGDRGRRELTIFSMTNDGGAGLLQLSI